MGDLDETIGSAVELLGLAGMFLLGGVVFALAGFFAWPLHPDALMSWLS